jgi:hypothetical protein
MEVDKIVNLKRIFTFGRVKFFIENGDNESIVSDTKSESYALNFN